MGCEQTRCIVRGPGRERRASGSPGRKDRAPLPAVTKEVRVPGEVLQYLRDTRLKEIKSFWPCANGYQREAQARMLDGGPRTHGPRTASNVIHTKASGIKSTRVA